MSLIPVEVYPKDSDKLVRVKIASGPLTDRELIIKDIAINEDTSQGNVDYDLVGDVDLTEEEMNEMLQPMLEQLINSALQHAVDTFKEEASDKD